MYYEESDTVVYGFLLICVMLLSGLFLIVFSASKIDENNANFGVAQCERQGGISKRTSTRVYCNIDGEPYEFSYRIEKWVLVN